MTTITEVSSSPAATMARAVMAVRPGRIIAWTLLFLGGIVMLTPLALHALDVAEDASDRSTTCS